MGKRTTPIRAGHVRRRFGSQETNADPTSCSGAATSLLASLEPVHPVEVGVLLTRVRRGTLSARGVRDVLAETGLPVMDTEIPLAETYAGSFGTAPVDLGRYDDLIRELKS